MGKKKERKESLEKKKTSSLSPQHFLCKCLYQHLFESWLKSLLHNEKNVCQWILASYIFNFKTAYWTISMTALSQITNNTFILYTLVYRLTDHSLLLSNTHTQRSVHYWRSDVRKNSLCFAVMYL